MSTVEKLFLNDPTILIKKDRIFEMVPLMDMSTEEKINSTMRLVLYSTVLLLVTSRITKSSALIFLVSAVGISWLVSKNYETLSQLLDIMESSRIEDYASSTPMKPTRENPFANQLYGHPDLPVLDEDSEDKLNKDEMEARFYDSQAKMLDVSNPYLKNRRHDSRNYYHVPKLDRTKFANYLHKEYIEQQDQVKEDTTTQFGAYVVKPIKLYQDLKSTGRKPLDQINMEAQEDASK